MSNAESLKAVVAALGGTPSGATNAALIQEIAALLGSEASSSSNSEALSNLAAAATGKKYGAAQTKTATAKTTKVTVTPDAGKVLTKVEVSAVTASIDANIAAGNIKKGVAILGVTGTYEGSGWRLWSGEMEEIYDADEGKWAADVEVEVVTVVDTNVHAEGQFFARKGDASDLTVRMPVASWTVVSGNREAPSGIGTASVYLEEVGGVIGVQGSYLPLPFDSEEDLESIDTSLALNDANQPDRIMVWVRRGLRATRSRGEGPQRCDGLPDVSECLSRLSRALGPSSCVPRRCVPLMVCHAHHPRMTNAESLASVVTTLGGTPSGATNAELLAEIVAALGGTPSPGSSNDELIAQVATAYAAATADLEAGNIKKDVTILGVTGTYEGGGRRARPHEVRRGPGEADMRPPPSPSPRALKPFPMPCVTDGDAFKYR